MRPFHPAAGLPATLDTDPSSVMSLCTLPGPGARFPAPAKSLSVGPCMPDPAGLSTGTRPESEPLVELFMEV